MTTSPDNTQTRALTPGRIIALVLIALAVLGLVYLRIGSGDESVSVPKGAQAGDLILDNCDYETEAGTYAAECGTLVVPEDRADPGSRLVAVPVTRIKANSETPAEPIFRLEGGPGITNMEFPKASRYAENHDIVLVGYRGVDGSVQLDCPEVESALARSTDLLSQKSFTAYGDAFRACADRLIDEGVDPAGYGLVQQVDDLEAARKAFGYEQVDLLSESAGTRTAMIYAWRYPESIHRSVMFGANPPGNFLWQEKTTDEQLGRYAALCAQDDGCRTRTDDLVASMRRTDADIDNHWFGLPIEEGNVRVASFFGLMEATPEAAPASGPMTLDAWLAADGGDASGQWFQSFAADLMFSKLFVWGQYASAARLDAQAAKEYFADGEGYGPNLGRAATAYVWGGGSLADAWPAASGDSAYARPQRSEVETLLVNGELDFTTPPQVAKRQLLPYLPNGHQVVLPGIAHSVDFWSSQPEANKRLVNTFFDSGRVDDSLYVRQEVDFSPGLSHMVLAKGIAGTMVALALLTVLSLLWMARRVHKRGGFGRKGAAVLRSVYPILLGLGGWFAGLLIVLTTMPGVPLDDELLAALAVGIPVGLGVYLAWVRRDWSAGTKAAGFAAAVVGALVGAWFGFNAADDLLALVTAIVGSVAGANLALLLFDMWRAHSTRDRTVQKTAVETGRGHAASATPAGSALR